MLFFFCHLPFFAGILFFLTHHLGLTLMRATASYLYEGLVASPFVPYAADRDGVSTIGCVGHPASCYCELATSHF